MYSIQVDNDSSVVSVVLGGMMTPDEVGAYVADLKKAFISHKLRSYSLIIDVTDCPIQTQESIRSFGEHMGAMPKATAIAVVTGSSLAKMQIRRLFHQPYTRIVATVQEGRAWVYNGAEPLAA